MCAWLCSLLHFFCVCCAAPTKQGAYHEIKNQTTGPEHHREQHARSHQEAVHVGGDAIFGNPQACQHVKADVVTPSLPSAC